MNVLLEKLKEMLVSVVPIMVLVLIISLTLVPIDRIILTRFFVGAFLIIFGLTLFMIGVDTGITPLGSEIGKEFAKSNKIWIVIIGGFIIGFFVSIAEPDLLVLAKQVELVTGSSISQISLLVAVSTGLAIMMSVGFMRILEGISLRTILLITYGLIFVLSIFVSDEFLGISFDSSGATTGILAVPFMLALSSGISSLKKDSKAGEEDSFGLVGLASSGAIVGVMLLDIFSKNTSYGGDLPVASTENLTLMGLFTDHFFEYIQEAFLSILPLLVILFVMQFLFFKLPARRFIRMITGFAFAFIGLILFLMGVNGGFMDVGRVIGMDLVARDSKIAFVLVAFVIGFVTILAEPAVHVLTHQIEDVTAGSIKRKSVLVPLTIGVGLAIMLSAVRIIVPGLSLKNFLIPGYIIALGLTFTVPSLFVGMAFDSGGVSTGPVTATFILAFVQGAAATYPTADILTEGFGMIAMVAMFPIITLQILGYIYKKKIEKLQGVKK